MRPLESVLILTAAFAAARPWLPFRHARTPTLVVAALPVIAMVLQLVVEGGRWQLIPLWGVTVAVVILAIRDLIQTSEMSQGDEPEPEFGARAVSPALLGLAVAAGAVLSWALPVVALPTPSGPYAVGTTTTAVIDRDRTEIYGPNPGGPRTLPVQVWYPAQGTSREGRHPWLIDRDGLMVAAAQKLGLPGFSLGHLELVVSSSVLDAPVAGTGELPVVIYSHGWSGARELHATKAELLASNGYVVIAADHTYGALATHLPDGTLAELDDQALPSDVPYEEYEAAAEQLVATYAADIESLLEAIFEEGHLNDIVGEGRLVEGSLGIVGHSTGGGAAIKVCERDERCSAAVAYDPWVEPVPDEIIGGDLAVPLLSIRSEEWAGSPNDDRLRRLHAGSSAPQGLVLVDGVNHRDLTLLPLFSPLSSMLGLSGRQAGIERLRSVDEWTLRFFDHHLRDRGLDPFNSPPVSEGLVLENTLTDPG